MRRLWRTLRSRKLAVWAIIAFTVYAAVATTASDGDWSVPYRRPAFLAIAAVLAASTAACAWERTKVAIGAGRLKPPSTGSIARLRERPAFVISIAPGVDALQRSEEAIGRLRMRTLRTGESLEGRGGLAGAFGSPVFHWALSLLFVAVVLGQLTRAEGLMGVAEGSSKPDEAAVYGVLDKGPLAELTGRQISVPSIESSYTANGVEQGITPYVEVRTPDGATVLASGHAYANHPIRYRSMLVHMSDDGLAAILEVTGMGNTFTDEILLDYNAERTAVEPAIFGLQSGTGATITTVMIEPAVGSTAAASLIRIRAVTGDGPVASAPELDEVAQEGDLVTLPGGLVLRIISLSKYARLSVVNDWSVYPIYALFAVAVIGLVLALFTPPRGVRALLVTQNGEEILHVTVRHGRGDPHFPGRVEAALLAALSPEEES